MEMNTKLRAKAKTDFEKYFFKLMNNFVSGKTMKNIRKHRDIKLVTTDKKRNKLASEPNYHTARWFSENYYQQRWKNKILIYEFCYDYIKSKYQQNAKLCHMDTYSFVIHIET